MPVPMHPSPNPAARNVFRHPFATRCLFAVMALLLAGVSAQQVKAAGSELIAPSEVVLYIHADLKSIDFVRPLVCALQRVLVAPVSTQVSGLPLGNELRASATQFDVTKLANEFIRTTPAAKSSFQYLLLPYDLKSEPWRYVFATSFGNQQTSFHLGIISTARLDVEEPTHAHHQGAEITATRIYKLILKSIARVAGLSGPDRCVLIFPRSLDELDQKLASFCPEDHARLVASGILKATETSEGTDCVAVSDTKPKDPGTDTRPLLTATWSTNDIVH